MHSSRFVIALAVMLGWSAFAPSANASSEAHNFYGIHKEVRDKRSFIWTMHHSLKLNPERLVMLYNQHYGSSLGPVANFDQLLAILGSSEFEVQPCAGTIFSFGFYDSGQFEAFPRGCYANELVLVSRRTRAPVFSLLCGNMLLPPPLVYTPPPPAPQETVHAGVVYTNKCGFWILYGCLDSQSIEQHENQTSPYFRREGGYSGIIPQHD